MAINTAEGIYVLFNVVKKNFKQCTICKIIKTQIHWDTILIVNHSILLCLTQVPLERMKENSNLSTI